METPPFTPWMWVPTQAPALGSLPEDYAPVDPEVLKAVDKKGSRGHRPPHSTQQTWRQILMRWMLLAMLRGQGMKVTDDLVARVATASIDPGTPFNEALALFR